MGADALLAGSTSGARPETKGAFSHGFPLENRPDGHSNDAVATASGMAAISPAVISVVSPGDRIVAVCTLYSDAFHLLESAVAAAGCRDGLCRWSRPRRRRRQRSRARSSSTWKARSRGCVRGARYAVWEPLWDQGGASANYLCIFKGKLGEVGRAETGIRTLGGVTPTTVFETAPFDAPRVSRRVSWR